mmetsp:Transcript_9006/g.24233  ORF Transcript_9006/g.24233 Transcript_9006/m.24233 type:complete len:107 (-) Transcript_9006:1566-1886(-)
MQHEDANADRPSWAHVLWVNVPTTQLFVHQPHPASCSKKAHPMHAPALALDQTSLHLLQLQLAWYTMYMYLSVHKKYACELICLQTSLCSSGSVRLIQVMQPEDLC